MVRYVPGPDRTEFVIPAEVASALKFAEDAMVNEIALAALAEGASRKAMRARGQDPDAARAALRRTP